jgi:RHS repeat-associated protein
MNRFLESTRAHARRFLAVHAAARRPSPPARSGAWLCAALAWMAAAWAPAVQAGFEYEPWYQYELCQQERERELTPNPYQPVPPELVVDCRFEVYAYQGGFYDGRFALVWRYWEPMVGGWKLGSSYYPFTLDADEQVKRNGCPTGRCGVAGVDPSTGNRFDTQPLFGGAAIAVGASRSHAPEEGGPAPGGVGSGVDGFPLVFATTYNSLGSGLMPTSHTGTLGRNVTHTYQRSVTLVHAYDADGNAQDWAYVERPDGNVEKYVATGGQWLATPDNPSTLAATRDAQGQLAGWVRLGADGVRETYDANGRLLALADRSGFVQSVGYDAGGRLQSVLDARGRALVFTHDAQGRITRVDLPDGRWIGFAYAAQRLSTVTDADGGVRRYLYGEAGFVDPDDPLKDTALTGVVDERGVHLVSTWYDGAHRAIRSLRAGGTEDTRFNYLVEGARVASATITHPTGHAELRTFAWVRGRNLTTGQTLSCAGCATRRNTRTYDALGYPDTSTDFAGVLTDTDVDAVGLVTRVVSAKGTAIEQAVTTQWDAALRSPLRIDRAGQRLHYTYNARGQVLTERVEDTATGESRTVTYAYCDQVDAIACPLVGLLRSIDGARADIADITRFAYRLADDPACATASTACAYRAGDLWTRPDAAGLVTEFLAYDGAGRPRSVRDANGVITDFEYSPRGAVAARKVRGADAGTEADDAITRIDYDPRGLPARWTQPDGVFVDFHFDDAQRLDRITDALGGTIRYTLDAAGLRRQDDLRDAAGTVRRTRSRVFDPSGLLVQAKDSAGRATVLTYDANGEADTSTDPLGHRRDRDLDALGRLDRVIDDAGGIAASTRYAWDGRDNLRQVLDPKGLATNYGYDGFDELVRLESPDTGVATFGYDAAGNRIAQTDGRGKATGYVYDALGRLRGVRPASGTQNVDFDYDPAPGQDADCAAGERFGAGRLWRVANETGSTRYCYDRFGNVVRKVQAVQGGSTLVVAATYDHAGRVAAMTYPSGAIATWVRDGNGHVSRVDLKPTATSAQSTLVAGVTYAPFGPATALTFGNGRQQRRVHDLDYGIDLIDDGVPGSGLSLDYGLDAVGNVVAANERGVVQRAYDYDGLDRLRASRSGATTLEAFSYDATGDRLTRTSGNATTTYTYPATSHRLASTGKNAARGYDGNGNTLSAGNYAWSYDERNRMRDFRDRGTLTYTHGYNGLGERVLRVANAAPANSRQFVYDEAGHLLGEYTTAGVRVAEYVWLDDLLVAVVRAHDGASFQYVETDALGTPRAVIHPAANTTIWRWDLTGTAFGEHAPDGDPDGNRQPYVLNLRYPGQYYDGVGPFNYNYFRDYDASIGRYLQSDPFGLDAGVSTYAYVESNPMNAIDPYGLYHCARGARCEGLTQGLQQSLRCFDACSSRETVVTCGTDSHRPGDPHSSGQAVDIGRNSNPGLSRATAERCYQQCFDVNTSYAQEERNAPRIGGTHFHIQTRRGIGGINDFRRGIRPHGR